MAKGGGELTGESINSHTLEGSGNISGLKISSTLSSPPKDGQENEKFSQYSNKINDSDNERVGRT
jgi:hypothetical protein